MRVRVAGVIAALLCLLASAPASAAIPVPEGAFHEGPMEDGIPRAELRLLTDREQLGPGEVFRVGVLFTLDPGWHVYWRNPGATGMSTVLRWQAAGLAVGATRWPVPEVFPTADGFEVSYGYGGDALLFAPAALLTDAEGELSVTVTVDYLVCDPGGCIPDRAELTRAIPRGDRSAPAEDRILAHFDSSAAGVPIPASDSGIDVQVVYSQEAIRPDDEFRFVIAVTSCAQPPGGADPPCPELEITKLGLARFFIPDELRQIDFEVVDSRPHPSAYRGFLVEFSGRAGSRDPGGDQELRGVICVRQNGEEIALDWTGALPRARPGAPRVPIDHPLLRRLEMPEDAAPIVGRIASVPRMSRWRAMALAFLGGMILNLMPCVLPVLALKVFGFARVARESRRRLTLHAGAYSLGILVAMLALALVVVGLQAAGHRAGWGFQFQEPMYVAIVAGVLVVFALNLFGAFEFTVSAGALGARAEAASGVERSMLEGVLAVVLATPCSAPFLGTAVGFAMTGSATTIVAVFLAVGLGLATPFATLVLFPPWARLLPEPGAWMSRLKQGLGFVLLGTVVWLVWIYGRHSDIDGIAKLLVFLLLVAASFWLFGALQSIGEIRRRFALALALVAVGAAGWTILPRSEASLIPEEERGPAPIDWLAFDEPGVVDSLGRGHPVFVDFTADWCITCRVNERTVIESVEVMETIERLGVVAYVADWTERDDRIGEVLARHGRSGVPMYLVYGPGDPGNPTVLPELLTIGALVDALEAAASTQVAEE